MVLLGTSFLYRSAGRLLRSSPSISPLFRSAMSAESSPSAPSGLPVLERDLTAMEPPPVPPSELPLLVVSPPSSAAPVGRPLPRFLVAGGAPSTASSAPPEGASAVLAPERSVVTDAGGSAGSAEPAGVPPLGEERNDRMPPRAGVLAWRWLRHWLRRCWATVRFARCMVSPLSCSQRQCGKCSLQKPPLE